MNAWMNEPPPRPQPQPPHGGGNDHGEPVTSEDECAALDELERAIRRHLRAVRWRVRAIRALCVGGMAVGLGLWIPAGLLWARGDVGAGLVGVATAIAGTALALMAFIFLIAY